MVSLKVLAFNCSLKASADKDESSTEVMLAQLLKELEAHGAKSEIIRAADYDIKPGVSKDEGKGDAWPDLRRKLLKADIVVIGTPIWLGQPSSISKRVLERMDAFLDEKDNRGRMPTCGKVGLVAVVGNEDGAHHVIAEVGQALTEVGFTLPPGVGTYWVGEALGDKNYKDLKKAPKAVAEWTTSLAAGAAHLAQILKDNPYPGVGNDEN
jgi:multimeric flavodoxin WrbA